MRITPKPETLARRKELLNEPYPMNLMLTVNEVSSRIEPLADEDIQQDNIDGLLYAVTLLPERTQEMIRLRYDERQTYKKIGETLGISTERVRYLVAEAERKLRSPNLYGYIKYGKVGREERLARIEEEKRRTESDVMKKPIDDLHLTTRAEIRLIAKGCHTIGDVVSMTRDEILSIRMFGSASVNDVATKLESLGITDSDWSYIICK